MKVRWLDPAFVALRATIEHIAADDPRAAVAFARDVLDRARRLEVFPYLGRPGRLADTRELIVQRNHLIVYSVTAEEVLVLQFWHMARDRP